MSLHVRTLSTQEHRAFLRSLRSSSFLQWPSWVEAKIDCRAESIGWIKNGDLVGTGLVLYRRPPGFERCFAYLPEGPVLDWYTADIASWLDPMVEHLRSGNPFMVRMGPPVVVRQWAAEAITKAVAAGDAQRLCDVSATAEDPRALDLAASLCVTGWRPDRSERGFGRIQPRYRVQVPLADHSLGEVLARCGKMRKRFTQPPLEYFQRMATAMTAEDPNRFRLYLARHDGEVLAATSMVTVGEHVWCAYTGSAERKREVRPSNAIQWRMLSDVHAAGASVYDLRGISDTLDPRDSSFGVTRFKIDSGGRVAAYLGEWSYPLDEPLYEDFQQYLDRVAG